MGDIINFWEIGRDTLANLNLSDLTVDNVVNLLRGVLEDLPLEHKQVIGGNINNIVLYDICVLDSQDWPCQTRRAIIFMEEYDKQHGHTL